MKPAQVKPVIDLEVVNQVDARVGTIESVSEVDGSNKLVRLTVDFGDHKRTIFAGMKQEREDPTEIEGRQALFIVAHLQAPGLFVHVEGRKPQKDLATAPGRPQKGWIKTVMAILIRPRFTNAPYRALADEADVALGTVAGCISDLAARGLLLKGKDGRRVTDRQALVALWVQAYIEGLRPKLRERRFQVRAEGQQEIWPRLQKVLAKRAQPWALTGADLAERRMPFFRADETEIYAPVRALEDRDAQKALVAQPAARGGNLLVIEPPGPLAMAGETEDDLPVAPGLLAYAELRYRGTGQALEAAELLLPEVLDDAAR